MTAPQGGGLQGFGLITRCCRKRPPGFVFFQSGRPAPNVGIAPDPDLCIHSKKTVLCPYAAPCPMTAGSKPRQVTSRCSDKVIARTNVSEQLAVLSGKHHCLAPRDHDMPIVGGG